MTHACSECLSTNVIGPFEMDGFVNGQYRPFGELWIVCRECGKSTHVPASAFTVAS